MSRRARAARSQSVPQKAQLSKQAAEQLATAVAAHRIGRLDDARAGYIAVLEQAPDNFDALNLLGVAAVQLGDPESAETLLRLALELRPRSHEAHCHLGMALRAQGREAEAEAALRTSLQLSPTHVDALRNLATLCQGQGRTAEAIALLTRAAAALPQSSLVRANLGALLLASGDAQRAWSQLEQAAPSLGNDPTVWANLARAGLETDRIEPATAACEHALRLLPTHLASLVTLSALERVRGRFDVAECHARAALDVSPNDRGALLNLATALAEMGRYEESTQVFDRLLAADPCDVEAHASRALVCLASGRPEAAWDDHAWRWRLPGAGRPHPPALPEWHGEPMPGGTLFVWPELGVGDELVHMSSVPDLVGRAGNVVLGCDPRLVEVFARSFPSVDVVSRDELPAMATRAGSEDRQCSMVDLSAVMRPTMHAYPRRAGYLVADPARVAHWRGWLESLGDAMNVGISWRSQNQSGERRLACTGLQQWAPVLAVPDVHFVCLQYDECGEEVVRAEAATGVRIHVPPDLDQRNRLDDVIALMHALDLVVTVATSVSTLAGAVGAPTWQLARGIDWHGMGRVRSPWQPSMQQVYKHWDVSWEDVLAGIGRDLQDLVSSQRAAKAA